MELQPCPFCAAKAEFNQTEDGGHFIECTSCRSSTSLRYSLMEDAKPILAEGWNRRAQLAAPVAAQSGYKLVPIEPTQAMMDDAEKKLPASFSIGDEYRAMVAAAPVAAQGTLCKPHSLPDCMWCRREAEATPPAPGARQP